MVGTAPRVDGDPFAAPDGPGLQPCRLCRTRIDTSDGYCRVCGASDPGGANVQTRSRPASGAPIQRTAPARRQQYRSSTPQGVVLGLGAILLVVGCKLPWLSANGFGFSMGLTPPFGEVWPVVAGGAILALIGTAAVTGALRLGTAGWLMGLLISIGVAGYMFPRYQDITEVISSGALFGVSHGPGLWMIGAGIAATLLACAGGLNATLQRN
ncbi:hypothetical protein HQ535_05735 [bacterium]|nr:hypothetical protein [bacterium]